jgi:hypothetical protein
MALANLIDQITIGEKINAVIDANPMVNGFSATIGSTAIWDDTLNVSHQYIKRSASDTGWDEISTSLMGGVHAGNFGYLPIFDTNATGYTVGDTYLQNTQPIKLAIAAQATRTAALTYTIPNPGDAIASAQFVLTEGAQTINGAKTFGSAVVFNGNVTIAGTLTTVNATDLVISDRLITLNKGGIAATGAGAGFEIEEAGAITGSIKVDASRNGYDFTAPNIASTLFLDQSALTANRTQKIADTAGTFVMRGSATPGVAGQITFWLDANNQVSDSALFWDNTNKWLGIGTTPSVALDVNSAVRFRTLATAGFVKNSATGAISTATTVNLTSEVSNVLPVINGGTNLSTAPSNGQLLIGNGTGYALATLTGTTNQVSVANAAGSITLSLPQSINAAATPTFANVTLSNNTIGSILFAGTAGVVSQNNTKLFWDNTNFRLGLNVAAPTVALDVAGDIKFTATLTQVSGTISDVVTQSTVATTDATVTSAAVITVPSNQVMMIEARIVGRKTAGTGSGNIGDAVTYIRTAYVKNIAGVVTLQKVQSDFTAEDITSCNGTIDVTGVTARVRVQGSANDNINWSVSYRVFTVA